MLKFLLDGLVHNPLTEKLKTDKSAHEAGAALNETSRGKLGRSLAVRMVDAGSCNGCELEIQALGNAYYDLDQYGIHFVASPRHADILLVTGPVTRNMHAALLRTYNAMPHPKWVVSVGDCTRGGGCFAGSYAVMGGVDDILPVDLHIPGCAPDPETLSAALVSLLDSAAQKENA